jgi:hypothetical protein
MKINEGKRWVGASFEPSALTGPVSLPSYTHPDSKIDFAEKGVSMQLRIHPHQALTCHLRNVKARD